jgi:hypothetical protein
MTKKRFAAQYSLAAVLFLSIPNVSAQTPLVNPPIPADNAAYSDVADLVTIAPMIVDAKIRKITKFPPEQATGVPANLQRALVEADVIALIRGSSGVAASIRFTLDIPKDSRGKIPNLKKQRFFFLGSAVADRPGTLRLARPDALITYSPANDALLRTITREAVTLDAPQKITGITSAFHSAGTVIGEGETQVFLRTENGQPFSLSISSRSGQPKKWSVSTSELIEEGASTPKKFTLLWYRLACGLPRQLPPELVQSGAQEAGREVGGEGAARAQADYSYIVSALGPCGRQR